MVTWIILWFKLILSLKQLFWPPPRTFVTFGPFLSTLLIGWTENYLRKCTTISTVCPEHLFFMMISDFRFFLKMEALQIWFDLSDWISKANLNKLWSKKILPWRRSFINRNFLALLLDPGYQRIILHFYETCPVGIFHANKFFCNFDWSILWVDCDRKCILVKQILMNRILVHHYPVTLVRENNLNFQPDISRNSAFHGVCLKEIQSQRQFKTCANI